MIEVHHSSGIEVQPVFELNTGCIKYVEVFGGGMSTIPWETADEAIICDLVVLRRICAFRDDLMQLNVNLGFNISFWGAINIGSAFVDHIIQRFTASRCLIEVTEHGPQNMDLDGLIKLGSFIRNCADKGVQVVFDDVSNDHPYRQPSLWNNGVGIIKVIITDQEMSRVIMSALHHKRDVVVENIESQEQFSMAQKSGAKYGQGYYLQKPVSLSDLCIGKKNLNTLKLVHTLDRVEK